MTELYPEFPLYFYSEFDLRHIFEYILSTFYYKIDLVRRDRLFNSILTKIYYG